MDHSYRIPVQIRVFSHTSLHWAKVARRVIHKDYQHHRRLLSAPEAIRARHKLRTALQLLQRRFPTSMSRCMWVHYRVQAACYMTACRSDVHALKIHSQINALTYTCSMGAPFARKHTCHYVSKISALLARLLSNRSAWAAVIDSILPVKTMCGCGVRWTVWSPFQR